MENTRFRDRTEAGRLLAELLRDYGGRDDVVVLALPRGGVPAGYEVAKALGVPLDAFIVRKLGVPGHEELAMGAIASGGLAVLNRDAIEGLGIGEAELQRAIEAELRELQRREVAYRGERDPPELEGKTVILVDDGLATGSTMRAAALAVRQRNPARIVVAVPVAAAETCDEFRDVVDEIICGVMPRPFHAVGLWYEDFSQTSDEELRELLARAAERAEAPRCEDCSHADRDKGPGMNRFFRRIQGFGKSFSARRSHGTMVNMQGEVFDAKTPQDVTSVRAKSTGHGKKTADKWNQ